jgi:hypothetical protein
MTEKITTDPASAEVSDRRPLSPAAARALAEAQQRRLALKAEPPAAEVDGPKAPEPTRFGDWERNGIVSDF